MYITIQYILNLSHTLNLNHSGIITKQHVITRHESYYHFDYGGKKEKKKKIKLYLEVSGSQALFHCRLCPCDLVLHTSQQ